MVLISHFNSDSCNEAVSPLVNTGGYTGMPNRWTDTSNILKKMLKPVLTQKNNHENCRVSVSTGFVLQLIF